MENSMYYKDAKTLELHREATYKEVSDTLKRDGRCGVVRHTGYGKSYIITRLMQEYKSGLTDGDGQ